LRDDDIVVYFNSAYTQVKWRLVAGARSIVARECLRDGSAAALCRHSCNSGDRAWGV